MPSTMTLYNSFYQNIGSGVLDLKNDTIKIILVTSAYTPDAAHTVLADINASPDPEVVPVASPDNGYTAGGETLTGQTVTQVITPAVLSTLDADNVTWTSLTAGFRYAVMYSLKTVGGIVNPLIAFILFDDTPADINIGGIDFIIQWPTAGIITWGPTT